MMSDYKSFNQPGCPAGSCSNDRHPTHWNFSVLDTLRIYVARFEPDIVYLNTGLWESIPGAINSTELVAAGLAAVARKNGSMFFKTTTSVREGPQVNDTIFAAQAERGGWKLYDAGKYTAGLANFEKKPGSGRKTYWDKCHFYPAGEILA